jgi:aspartate/methionine/tyrosine aminotransferase
MNDLFSDNTINYELLRERAFNLRWAQVAEGVIPLTAADPDFPSAPEIAEALTKFIKDRYFPYVPAEGYLFFREAIANFYEQKRKFIISPNRILPVDSAAFGILVACKAVLKPGDEAIIFDPVDFLFKHCIEQVGATAVSLSVAIDPAAPINLDKLRSLINHKTKMICLCNPINPTGKVFTKQELEEIAQIARENKLIILSDEIWSDIVFAPHCYTSIASLDEETAARTITVSGYSKSYGLAGLRVGFVMASDEKLFKKLFESSGHASTVHGCNALAQVAASTALNECAYWLHDFVEHLQRMRDLSLKEISTIPGFSCHSPQGCYLLFCNIQKTGYESASLQTLLLEKAKVAVVPGLPRWFGEGAAGHIRICFSTSENILTEAFSRIRQCLNAVK